MVLADDGRRVCRQVEAALCDSARPRSWRPGQLCTIHNAQDRARGPCGAAINSGVRWFGTGRELSVSDFYGGSLPVLVPGCIEPPG